MKGIPATGCAGPSTVRAVQCTMTETTPTPHLLRLGVLAVSRKADERRLPIHPAHVERIDPDLRARMVLERGYGDRFGVPDEQLEPLVGAMATRAEIIATTDVVLLPKPQAPDLADLRDGQVLWGGRTACRTRR